MTARRLVDPAEATRLFVEEKWPVRAIADRFGVQPPAIYRVLHATLPQGLYATRPKRQQPPPETGLPPSWPRPAARKHERKEGGPYKRSRHCGAAKLEHAPPPIPPRDPCPRCGVRGDIPCKHSRAPLGWRVG